MNPENQREVRELQAAARARADENEGAGGREALTQGAEGLMNAMRELLNTMTYRLVYFLMKRKLSGRNIISLVRFSILHTWFFDNADN